MRHRAESVAAVAIVVVLAVAFAPTAAQATFPGGNGKLAYGGCATDCGVFVVEPEGSGATQVTHNPLQVWASHAPPYPAPDSPTEWSLDSKRIVYTRSGQADFQSPFVNEVRIVNADGTSDEPFDAPPGAVTSPDGSKLAFVNSTPSGYPQISVMNADGSGARQVTNGTGAYDPDWSPDGTKIAFTQGPYAYTRSEIYVMDADGGNQTRLTFELDQNAWAFHPSWSPDGVKIAFTRSFQGQQYEVYSMNADGSGLVNLTDNNVGPPDYTRIDDESPVWSPDGTQIAFVRHIGGPYEIFVMNADGSAPRELVEGVNGTTPVWQPLRGPQRSDFKNASTFCKAERDFLGDAAFREKYGGGANAHGKCVSGS